jgi:putative ABC transport system permease protein
VSTPSLSTIGARHLIARKGTMAIAVSGVALGVAVIVAVRMINRSALAGFTALVGGLAGRASLQITRDHGTVSEELADRVSSVPGVALAVPLVQGAVFAADRPGPALTVLGIDVTNEEALRSYEAAADAAVNDPLVFLSQPDSVVVTTAFADRQDLRLGAPLAVDGPHGRATLRVRGFITPSGVARVFGGDLLLMDIQAAQRLLSKGRQVDQIDVVLQDGHDARAVAGALAAALPAGLRIEPPRQRGERMQRIVGAFQALVSGLGALVFAAGGFAAYATVATTVLARRHDLALLRMAGAAPGALRRLLLGEGLVVGVVAALLGLPLASLVGSALRGPVTASATLALRVPVTAGPAGLTPLDVLVGVCAAVGTTVAASALAVRGILDVSPLEALRGNSGSIRRSTSWSVTAPVLLLGMASVAALWQARPGSWEGNAAILAFHVTLIWLARPAILVRAEVIARRAPLGRAPSRSSPTTSGPPPSPCRAGRRR